MWNERFKEFDGEKTEPVLWKDVKMDEWYKCCQRLTHHLKCLSKLDIHSQNAIISRIIYKHENQMRRDKPFQYFKRVNKLVERYCAMRIHEYLNTFKELVIAIKCNRYVLSKAVHIPVRLFTLFLIEQLYASYQLVCKVITSCQETYLYLDSHTRYGFFVAFNLFAVASVSRIWSIFKEAKHLIRELSQLIKGILETCYDVDSIQCSEELQKILEDDLNETADTYRCNAIMKMKGSIVAFTDKLSESQSSKCDIIPIEDLGESVNRSMQLTSINAEENLQEMLKSQSLLLDVEPVNCSVLSLSSTVTGCTNKMSSLVFDGEDLGEPVQRSMMSPHINMQESYNVPTTTLLTSTCVKFQVVEEEAVEGLEVSRNCLNAENADMNIDCCNTVEMKCENCMMYQNSSNHSDIKIGENQSGKTRICIKNKAKTIIKNENFARTKFMLKRQPVGLGALRSPRGKHLIPYPLIPYQSLHRSIKHPFHGGQYRNVTRKLNDVKRAYKIIRKLTRQLKDIDDVRHALQRSASKQETIYLVMQLRRLQE